MHTVTCKSLLAKIAQPRACYKHKVSYRYAHNDPQVPSKLQAQSKLSLCGFAVSCVSGVMSCVSGVMSCVSGVMSCVRWCYEI